MSLQPGDLVRIAYRKHELAMAIAVDSPYDYSPSVWGVLWCGQVRRIYIDDLELVSRAGEE